MLHWALLLVCANGQLGQPTIGVVDFTVTQNAQEHSSDISGYRWGSGDTKSLTSEFTTVLSKSRKFNILERDRIRELYAELDYDKNSTINSVRQFKKESLKGAGFLVIGEIERFKINSYIKKVPYSDHRKKQIYEVTLITGLRLVHQRDGSIVFWDKASVSLKTSSATDLASVIEQARAQTAEILVGRIIDELYPVMVISARNKQLFLTLSKSPYFKVGQVLTVYGIDDEVLIDPQTGEELGNIEEPIGKVKLTQILPKYAKAVILEGGDGVKAGDICRPD